MICKPVLVGRKGIASNLIQSECAMGWCSRSRALEELEKMGKKLKGDEDLHIAIYIKPCMFAKIVETSHHHSSDASEKVCNQCSFLRLTNDKGEIQCSLFFAKSRAFPKKFLSITRLELTAGILSVKMVCLIRKKLNFSNIWSVCG